MSGRRAVDDAMAARGAKDITVSVNYRMDTGFQQYESRPETMGKIMPVSVKMLDARTRELCMRENGFELIDQATGMSRAEFLDDAVVRQKYYPLCQEAIKKVTGAPIVICFHHLVRGHGTGRPFAGIAHADYSTKTAHKVLQDIPPPGIKDFKGRLCVLNLWRNINPDSPLQNHFLAMCDGGSVLAPDDFISVRIPEPGKETETHMFQMSANNHRLHKWYYYPLMTADENLIFMQYDSDPHSKCRYTFHSSVSVNDGTLEYKRESIEVRCVAYFPDAENTMPDWTLPADMRVDAAVDVLKQHTMFVPNWKVRAHQMGAASYIMAGNHKGWLLEFLEHQRRQAHHAAYKDLSNDQQDEVAEIVATDPSWKQFMDQWAPTMYDDKDQVIQSHLISKGIHGTMIQLLGYVFFATHPPLVVISMMTGW